MRTSTGGWAAVAAGALLSCGATRAAVYVRVDTDITQAPMGDLRAVRVRVYAGFGPTRTPRHDSVRTLGGADGVHLPFRFVVLPLGDDESRVVTVEVVGCSDVTCGDERPGYTPILVEQRAIVSFIPGEQWELPVFLASNCRGVRCDTVDPRLESTCRPETGACGGAQVTPGRLDASTATDTPRPTVDVTDAASQDGPMRDVATDFDAPRDSAPDVPSDAAAEATADAARDAPDDAETIDRPATPDASQDVPTEPVRSCGSGASTQVCRPQENCCVLGGCGCVVVALCTPRGLVGCL